MPFSDHTKLVVLLINQKDYELFRHCGNCQVVAPEFPLARWRCDFLLAAPICPFAYEPIRRQGCDKQSWIPAFAGMTDCRMGFSPAMRRPQGMLFMSAWSFRPQSRPKLGRSHPPSFRPKSQRKLGRSGGIYSRTDLSIASPGDSSRDDKTNTSSENGSTVRNQEIATATFCGLAMTIVPLRHPCGSGLPHPPSSRLEDSEGSRNGEIWPRLDSGYRSQPDISTSLRCARYDTCLPRVYGACDTKRARMPIHRIVGWANSRPCCQCRSFVAPVLVQR